MGGQSSLMSAVVKLGKQFVMPLGQGEEASGGTRSASIVNETFCFLTQVFVFSMNSPLWETVLLFLL